MSSSVFLFLVVVLRRIVCRIGRTCTPIGIVPLRTLSSSACYSIRVIGVCVRNRLVCMFAITSLAEVVVAVCISCRVLVVIPSWFFVYDSHYIGLVGY